jgi:hypothetical protein
MEISGIVIALIHMAFKVVFLAHSPDADPVKHRSVIDTGKYQLYSIVVQNQTQAVNECRKLVEKEGIHSIVLCPGLPIETSRKLLKLLEITPGYSSREAMVLVVDLPHKLDEESSET